MKKLLLLASVCAAVGGMDDAIAVMYDARCTMGASRSLERLEKKLLDRRFPGSSCKTMGLNFKRDTGGVISYEINPDATAAENSQLSDYVHNVMKYELYLGYNLMHANIEDHLNIAKVVVYAYLSGESCDVHDGYCGFDFRRDMRQQYEKFLRQVLENVNSSESDKLKLKFCALLGKNMKYLPLSIADTNEGSIFQRYLGSSAIDNELKRREDELTERRKKAKEKRFRDEFPEIAEQHTKQLEAVNEELRIAKEEAAQQAEELRRVREEAAQQVEELRRAKEEAARAKEMADRQAEELRIAKEEADRRAEELRIVRKEAEFDKAIAPVAKLIADGNLSQIRGILVPMKAVQGGATAVDGLHSNIVEGLAILRDAGRLQGLIESAEAQLTKGSAK